MNKEKPGKKVLVIGGTGFIGRNLIESLLFSGYRVVILDLLKPAWLPDEVRFVEGSFLDEHLLDEALTRVHFVFHLASTTLPKTSNDNPHFDVSTNLSGTVKLLEKCVEHKIQRFIFPSSGGTIYGIPTQFPVNENDPKDPTCSYGIVKLTIEKYLRLFHTLYGLETISLRISNPFGEHQRFDRAHGAITVFCSKALKNETIEIWGDGSISRDFIYIGDVVKAMMKTLTTPCTCNEINIGSGTTISLNEIIAIIEDHIGKKLKVKYLPPRKFDVPKTFLDITKAKDLLDWAPETSFETGITRTFNWLKENS